MAKHPDMFEGGYQRTPGRFHYDLVPYERSWKRIVLRSGFEPNDQYLTLDGLQGIEWSYDDIQSIITYTDLGQSLLKSQWDDRPVESRLDMNSVFVSRGRPGQKQSVASECVRALDAGPHGLLSLKSLHHDGMTWTRHIFWSQGEWILVADELKPLDEGAAYVAQSWLSRQAFSLEACEKASVQVGPVSLSLQVGKGLGFKELVNTSQGVQMRGNVSVPLGRSAVLFTLLSAHSPDPAARLPCPPHGFRPSRGGDL